MHKIIQYTDIVSSRLLLALGVESNALTIMYLHGVYANAKEKEAASGVTMSYDGITLDGLRNVIEYFITHRYTFISPEDVLNGLDNNRKYIMLTFDDGYASNSIVLQVLKEFKVPAVFFISAGHVLKYKCFWWDVLYREMTKRSCKLSKIQLEIQKLKQLRAEEIDEVMIKNYGPDALKPINDLDRPFTVKELREFSRQPYVFVGNHTMDHAILTNYSENGVRSQIMMAQEVLSDIVKSNLPIISYPSGAYSPAVLKICREMKFQLGFTIEPVKVAAPLSRIGDSSLSIGRYSLKSNDGAVLRNCDIARSDFLCSRYLKKVLSPIITRHYTHNAIPKR